MAVKPITIKDTKDGNTYTLEFNRESVKFAEDRGFRLEDVGSFPMTKLPEFFFYAFRMHHPKMSKANTDKILFEELNGIPEGMIERLIELYNQPFECLGVLGEGEERKNSKLIVEM